MAQSKIILALIIIMGIGIGYFYYTSVSGEPAIPPIPNSASRDSIDDLSALNLDFSILDDEAYKSLQQFGQSPVTPGVTGAKNMFSPF